MKTLEQNYPQEDKSEINWGLVAFIFFIFCALILPILMIAFDFGPTETADTKEEMEQQLIEDNPWPY